MRRSCTIRITTVIRLEELVGADVVGSDPAELFVGTFVTGPTNVISELNAAATVVLGVEDLRDLVMFVGVRVFEFNRSGRRLRAVRDGVRIVRFKLRDVENGMDSAEVRWEP